MAEASEITHKQFVQGQWDILTGLIGASLILKYLFIEIIPSNFRKVNKTEIVSGALLKSAI